MRLNEEEVERLVQKARKAIEEGGNLTTFVNKECRTLDSDEKLDMFSLLTDRLRPATIRQIREERHQPFRALAGGRIPPRRSGKDAAAGAEAEERRESLDIPNPHERAS